MYLKMPSETWQPFCLNFNVLSTEWLSNSMLYLPAIRSHTTRTTRTPAFWGYPPPPHDYPYHWVILDPKSKEDKVKVTNLKKFVKISNFLILKRALHATHLLKLLDKMCKYEMDPMSIVEDTERTRFCPQTDRRTDGQTDKVIPVYPPINFVESGGIIIFALKLSWSSGRCYHNQNQMTHISQTSYCLHQLLWSPLSHMQCGGIITRSIFSQIFIKKQRIAHC